MHYSKIVNYFDGGEEGIKQLLLECNDIINLVEGCGDMLLEGQMGEEDYKTQLNIQTGAFNFFDTVYNISQAYKEIEEDKAYSSLRTEAETQGKKLTADAIKVEAHQRVGYLIKIRNIFESYVNRCSKNIITIQSQINRLEKNRMYKPTEE